jgi:hypothetical protein
MKLVHCRQLKSTAKLIRCSHHNSAVKTDSLTAPQFNSENWFAAGHTIQQRKQIHYRQYNSVANIDSPQTPEFSIIQQRD